MAQDVRSTEVATTVVSSPCPVADTMRRVHEQLRSGTAPSFEAMLAYGVPETRGSR